MVHRPLESGERTTGAHAGLKGMLSGVPKDQGFDNDFIVMLNMCFFLFHFVFSNIHEKNYLSKLVFLSLHFCGKLQTFWSTGLLHGSSVIFHINVKKQEYECALTQALRTWNKLSCAKCPNNFVIMPIWAVVVLFHTPVFCRVWRGQPTEVCGVSDDDR